MQGESIHTARSTASYHQPTTRLINLQPIRTLFIDELDQLFSVMEGLETPFPDDQGLSDLLLLAIIGKHAHSVHPGNLRNIADEGSALDHLLGGAVPGQDGMVRDLDQGLERGPVHGMQLDTDPFQETHGALFLPLLGFALEDRAIGKQVD